MQKKRSVLICLAMLVTLFIGASTSATASGDGAQFVSQSVPTSLSPRQIKSISVTFLNNGSTTWTKALLYRLGSQNPQDNLTWGIGRVVLADNASIAPNQQVTFTFNITAPATPGTYNLQWRMLRENVAWFGDFTPNDAVTVAQQVTLCPGVQVVADGLTDAGPALQQCINNTASGGTLQIPAAAYGIGTAVNITKPITIRTSGTAGSTQNCTGAISCATLRARPDLFVFGGFVYVSNTTDVTLDHLIFDGNRSTRLGSAAAAQCPTQSRYGYNVRVSGCTFCNFLYNLDENTLCGTSLEWVGDNAKINDNVFRANGDHSQTNMWSDGLTLLISNGADVEGNAFTDNSDVALILGGSRNGYVATNTITQATQAAFAAFSLDDFAGTTSGDYTGAIVTQNTINCGASNLCDFGMNFGPHAWLSTAPNIFGGSVFGNTVSSAKQGINADGAGTTASPLVLYSNTATGSPASATFNCGVRSTSNLNIFTGDSVVNPNGDNTPATNIAWDNCP